MSIYNVGWYTKVKIHETDENQISLFSRYGNNKLVFRNLIAGNNVLISFNGDDDIEIAAQVSVSGSSSTGINIGSGQGIYAGLSGIDLRFRSLVGSGGTSVSSGSTEITISSSAQIDNNAQNLGQGEGIFKGKTGTDLLFRSLMAGENITITSGTNFVQISSSGGGGGLTHQQIMKRVFVGV